MFDEGIGGEAGDGFEVLERGITEVAFLSLELGGELIEDLALGGFVGEADKLFGELGEGDFGVNDDGLHGRELVERFEDTDGVEDAEGLFADFVAEAGGAAEHLVEEDAAIDAAEEDQIADGRDVYARRKQVDGNRDIRRALILEAADELQGRGGSAGDLEDGVIFDAAVVLFEGGLEEVDDEVGMGIVGAEDEGFLWGSGVKLASEILADDLVERFGDDFAVEAIDVDGDLVGGFKEADFALAGIVDLHLFAAPPADAFGGEGGFDLDGRLIVDQIAIDDGIAVGVGVNGRPEDL